MRSRGCQHGARVPQIEVGGDLAALSRSPCSAYALSRVARSRVGGTDNSDDFSQHWVFSSPQMGLALGGRDRSEEHTSELQSHLNIVCRLLLEKKKHIVSAKLTTP